MRKPYPSDVTDAQWARIAPVFAMQRGLPRAGSRKDGLH